MRALILVHRWFGVAFCLLFAMWFASGAIMHWVAYPELTEDERIAGLSTFAPAAITLSPVAVLEKIDRNDVTRLRLTAPGGHPVYVATLVDSTPLALDAATGAPPAVDAAFALASATAHATSSGLIKIAPAAAALADYDQWTVAGGLNAHRPLHRIALNDAAGTELYVSSLTGEVVRDTTRYERVFNYAGSVLHWLYPTALRKHAAAWNALVWWLSLIATLGALAGAALGVLRARRFSSPYQGWQYWHHVLGLCCATFVLTWIFSGWLSMDSGTIFSDGRASADEIARINGPLLTSAEEAAVFRRAYSSLPDSGKGLREMEWFRLGGFNIERTIAADGTPAFSNSGGARTFPPHVIALAAQRLGQDCTVSPADDSYAARSRTAGAPVYRIVCGDTWWHVDSADGRIVEKLDASRRAYRWAFRALHTLDFPALTAHPALHHFVVMLLCAAGFAFSMTGVVIGWRRLRARGAG